jgi:hypothetical protein
MEFLDIVLKEYEKSKEDARTEYLYQNVFDRENNIKDNAEKFAINFVTVIKDSKSIDYQNIKKIVECNYSGDIVKKDSLIKEYTDNYDISMLKKLSEQIQIRIKGFESAINVVELIYNARYEERGGNTHSIEGINEMLEGGLECLKIKNEFIKVREEIDYIIQRQETSTAATAPEPDLKDFSEGTDIKTKIAILQELGILSYLMKKPSVNSANKVATLLSAVLGINSTTLQPYINPIFSPNADQTKAPKKIHKEKARQILLALDYTD